MARGINYAVKNGARIIVLNTAHWTDIEDRQLAAAIDLAAKRGVLVFANGFGGQWTSWPASSDATNVVVVGPADAADGRGPMYWGPQAAAVRLARLRPVRSQPASQRRSAHAPRRRKGSETRVRAAVHRRSHRTRAHHGGGRHNDLPREGQTDLGHGARRFEPVGGCAHRCGLVRRGRSADGSRAQQ